MLPQAGECPIRHRQSTVRPIQPNKNIRLIERALRKTFLMKAKLNHVQYLVDKNETTFVS
jgi:hypothetical protein